MQIVWFEKVLKMGICLSNLSQSLWKWLLVFLSKPKKDGVLGPPQKGWEMAYEKILE